MKRLACLLPLCVVLCALAVPAAGQTLYGAVGAGQTTSNLFTLNTSTGALATTIGPIGFGITGLAFHPTTGVLYGSTNHNSGASPDNLITINTTTGAGTVVGPFGSGCRVADLTFTSDGTLYGWCEPGTDDLVTINLATGAATVVGDSGLSTFGSGIAANSSNVLYFSGEGDTGNLYTISRTTGLPTSSVLLNGSTDAPFSALAFDGSGVLYGCYGGDGSSARQLATINTTTGAITVIGPSVNNMDAIAFRVSNVSVPTLDTRFLAIFGALLAVAAVLVIRSLKA
jgi:hypothetical protein